MDTAKQSHDPRQVTFPIAANIRKATRTDARYLQTDPLFSPYWTPERDRELAKLGRTAHIARIARTLRLPVHTVSKRIALLGIPVLTQEQAGTPTKGEWLGAATRAAMATNLDPVHILRGARDKPYVLARWKAWRMILDENPDYTVNGVAAISGHDHTTVLHGLRELKKLEPILGSRV